MPKELKAQCTRCRNKHRHTDRTSMPNTTISGMRY